PGNLARHGASIELKNHPVLRHKTQVISVRKFSRNDAQVRGNRAQQARAVPAFRVYHCDRPVKSADGADSKKMVSGGNGKFTRSNENAPSLWDRDGKIPSRFFDRV